MVRRKYQPKDGMDIGTPEMARRFTIVPKLSSPTVMSMKILDGSEADRMLMQDEITAVEHGTLNTLAKRLRDFGYDELRSPNYEGSGGGLDPEIVGDRKANKIRGAVDLIAKMDSHPHIGRYRRKKLVNLSLYDAPWGNKRNQIEELHACIHALEDIFIRR